VQQLVRLTLCFPWAGTSTVTALRSSAPEAQPKALAAGIEFQVIGEKDFLVGSTTESLTKLGQLRGLAALQYTIHLLKEISAVTLRCSALMKAAGVEALLVNQSSVEGGTIADFLEIPFVTVCSAVVLNREPGIPPLTPIGSIAQLGGHVYVTKWVIRYLIASPNHSRRDRQYRRVEVLYSKLNDAYSQLAQISQAPAEFEYPRRELPPPFHRNLPYFQSGTCSFPL